MMDERGEAIEHFYRQRYVHFRDGIATITGSYETARDLVQEAFARILRKRRAFRGEGSLEAWVWKIAVRTAYEH
jgi:DNA-directed RNA polymerase specialized sigma24 family protein